MLLIKGIATALFTAILYALLSLTLPALYALASAVGVGILFLITVGPSWVQTWTQWEQRGREIRRDVTQAEQRRIESMRRPNLRVQVVPVDRWGWYPHFFPISVVKDALDSQYELKIYVLNTGAREASSFGVDVSIPSRYEVVSHESPGLPGFVAPVVLGEEPGTRTIHFKWDSAPIDPGDPATLVGKARLRLSPKYGVSSDDYDKVLWRVRSAGEHFQFPERNLGTIRVVFKMPWSKMGKGA